MVVIIKGKEKIDNNSEIIDGIYHVRTAKTPIINKELDKEFEKLEALVNDHYVRITDYNDATGFDIHIFVKREKPLYDVTIYEKYLLIKKDINFKSKCFDFFNVLGKSKIAISRFYSDTEQIRAYMFYFSLYTVDEIIFKDKTDMISYHRDHFHPDKSILKENIDNKREKMTDKLIESSALGMFVQKPCYTSKSFVKERFIWLCKELIDEYYPKLMTIECIKDLRMRNIDFLNIVFFHEIGHSAFNHSGLRKEYFYDKKLSERRANYFCSDIYNGKYDSEMLELTMMQPRIYHDPLLKTCRCIYSDYEDQVDSLFKEEV